MGRLKGMFDMARARRCVILLALPVVLLLADVDAMPAHGGPAVGQFEMKDLEAEVGEIEFQSQNAWSFGQPRRRFAEEDPGEVVYDGNEVTRQRHALEIEMTPNRFMRLRVGIEYEKERLDEPASPALADAFDSLKLTEVAVEGVVIVRPIPEDGGVGFGLLSEFEHPLQTGEMNSILFGPILGARYGDWSALINVMFIRHFGSGEVTEDGVERDHKWDIGYAAQLKYDLDRTWALALEAYGTFDRIGNSGQRDEAALLFGDHNQHRAGPVVYREWRVGGESAREKATGRRGIGKAAGLDDDDARGTSRKVAGQDDDREEGVLVRLGTGVLAGLNGNTPAATLKMSLEVEW